MNFDDYKAGVAKRWAENPISLRSILGAGKKGLLAGAAAVSLAVLLFVFKGHQVSFSGNVPKCDSPFTRDLIKQTFAEPPAAQQGLKMIKVGKILRFDGQHEEDFEDLVRSCTADVYANIGQGNIQFTLSFIDKNKKDEVWLNVSNSHFW